MSAAWPPPVRPGDRIGIAALSGAASEEAMARGVRAVEELGFTPVLADNALARCGPLAGDDAARVDGFHRLLADDSLGAILFARGGYGLMRVLPQLDWELIGRRPRAWVGYSDLTPFLLQVTARQRLVTFHGPMVATDLARGLGAAEARSLLAALAGEERVTFPVAPVPGADQATVEGPLLGGCLSLLTAVLGTPWAVPFDGSILFLEDVNEPLYKLDRMLTHLRLSGSLAAVRAIVAGHLGADWEAALAGATSAAFEGTGHDVANDGSPWHRSTLLADGVPVAHRLPSGHGVPNLTLPLGALATLDPRGGELRVERGV